MRILVTGANGYIGAELVKELLKQGNEVIGFVRKSSVLKRLENIPVKLVFGDMTDFASLKHAMHSIDCVYHLAAYVSIGRVDIIKMETINIEGTKLLLEAASQSKVKKIIYCSTIGIYGDSKGEVVTEEFLKKKEKLKLNYYRTKHLAQKIVDEYAANGLPIISILPAAVVGECDPHFFPILRKFIAGHYPFIIAAKRLIEIVHVKDLVQAFILAQKHENVANHYIISSGRLTVEEIFDIICRDLKIKKPIEIPKMIVKIVGYILEGFNKIFSMQQPILSRERLYYLYDRKLCVSANKARKHLHWRPRSTRQTILEVVENINMLKT